MQSYFKLLRPYNWIKNFFVFVPLFFSRSFYSHDKLIDVVWSFIAFSLTASCVYVINDLVDREQDRKHPIKQKRPLASGVISPAMALLLLAFVCVVCVLVTIYFIPSIWPYLVLYFILNLSYSLWLKKVAAVDILLIASFYLIRVLVGGVAASVPISHWLILCTIFISLFLICGKRKAEYSQDYRRQVLESYHPQVLDGLLVLSATLAVICYSLYTVLVLNSDLAVYSVFFVLLAVFRYLLIIHKTDKSEYPEFAIIADPIVVFSGFSWLILMYYIFYIN